MMEGVVLCLANGAVRTGWVVQPFVLDEVWFMIAVVAAELWLIEVVDACAEGRAAAGIAA